MTSVSMADDGERVHDEAAHERAFAVMQAVADGLTEQGLDIAGQQWAEAHYLKASNARGALCEATIKASGAFCWEYRAAGGNWTDPAQILAMVRGLLGADEAAGLAVAPAAGMPAYPGQTVKGAVGLMARAAGLRARLGQVRADEEFLEVSAEVQVTDPEQPERGRVWVMDNAIRWECRFAGTAGAELRPAQIVAAIGRSVPQLRILRAPAREAR